MYRKLLDITTFIVLGLMLMAFNVAPPSDKEVRRAIRSYDVQLAWGKEVEGTGSGVVFADGTIITAGHLFEDSRENWYIVVEPSDPETWLPVTVENISEEYDVAVASADVACPCAPLARLGPSIEDKVYAVGHPTGIDISYITDGYVQATREEDDLYITNLYVSWGSSGGGVYNDRGELIGLVSYMQAQILPNGFRVPANEISAVAGLAAIKSTLVY